MAGNFPVTNEEIDPAAGLPFLDLEGLFLVEAVPMSETQFKTVSGYALWHGLLGQCLPMSGADNP